MVTEIIVTISSGIIVSMEAKLNLARNHASLENLDYEHSGHTGFASTADLAGKASTADLLVKLDKNNFGWVIADHTYDPTYAYTKGDTVYYVDESNPYRGYLYVAKVDIAAPAGSFDYSKWETTTLERLIWYKQDKLESGTNIKTINGNSILGSGNLVVTASGSEVVETGKLVKKLYSDLSPYKLIFMYGYRDALSAPNQFCFCFMPDQLQVDGEDLQFYTIAGPSNWEYPIRLKRHSDGYVYWWSAYDYSGNTTFYVTKIVGVK